jgi:hypothetical protein
MAFLSKVLDKVIPGVPNKRFTEKIAVNGCGSLEEPEQAWSG